MELLQLLGLILYQMAGMLLSPLFWLVVLLIAWQTKRTAEMKSNFFHVPRDNVWRKTGQAIALGLLGGAVGSVFLVLLGVSVYELGIEYLWVVAILLMLINQRWMCFAYAGGVLSLSHYLFGWPLVNISQLMALVAVLHLVEALLILGSGHLKALPVYVMGRAQRLVGGFNMQNFWPLPLVALSATLVPNLPTPMDVLAMPQWWPLLPTTYLGVTDGHNVVYALLPVLAALGYSDLALTTTTKIKARRSAGQLLVYSIILLLLAILAAKVPSLAIVAAVFAPLGHEALIWWGQRKEMSGDYLFQAPERGLMILDVLDHYPAQRAGLASADCILRINGHEVIDQRDFMALQRALPDRLELTYERAGVLKSCTIDKWDGQNLGIIPVPEPQGLQYLDFKGGGGLFKQWLALARRFWKKMRADGE